MQATARTSTQWIALFLILAIPASAQITQIIDATGDGTTALDYPRGVAVDSSGNVFVQSASTDAVFKVAPSGTITRVLDATGDGTHGCSGPANVAVDPADNLYATCSGGANLFKITPGGTITRIWTPAPTVRAAASVSPSTRRAMSIPDVTPRTTCSRSHREAWSPKSLTRPATAPPRSTCSMRTSVPTAPATSS